MSTVDLRDRYVQLLSDALTLTLWDARDGSLDQPDRDKSRRLRVDGKDWPKLAHTMIGTRRMDNIRFCLEDVLRRNVPGDFIETGVWRGGACIFMRGILAAYGVSDRRVWVADSFAGLPVGNAERYPADANDPHHQFAQLRVSRTEVEDNFRRFGLLDDQVVFLEGWFKDTLPSAPIESIAVARLDGDMYESTMDALENLYPKISKSGYLIVDDYALEPCAQAVHDFRGRNGITDPTVVIDWAGIYWQKSRA